MHDHTTHAHTSAHTHARTSLVELLPSIRNTYVQHATTTMSQEAPIPLCFHDISKADAEGAVQANASMHHAFSCVSCSYEGPRITTMNANTLVSDWGFVVGGDVLVLHK